ncbi:MAG: alpha/beta hydrolase [Clostridia bacterium]|nr:alpha/beta hydrolase [Clostridia bacterium]
MIPALIVLCILIVVIVVLSVLINLKTKPRKEGAENQIAVGGMLESDDFDYGKERDKKLARSVVVKLMQVLWMTTAKSDAANHEKIAPNTPGGIREHLDIPYIDDKSRYHKLDVYYPEALAATRNPVIIDIHGGGWMYGDKELNKPYCLGLASRGYTVFSISYSLVPDVTVERQLQEIALAMQKIKTLLPEYPCDPSNVILTGDSAGGQLAAFTAVLLQSDELCEAFDVKRVDLPLSGLLLTSPVPNMNAKGYMKIYTAKMWGSNYKDKKTLPYMNFEDLIGYAELPPTYLITSAGDILAHDQTVSVYNTLKKHKVNCVLADFGGEEGKKLPHVFSVLSPYEGRGKSVVDDALKFLNANRV